MLGGQGPQARPSTEAPAAQGRGKRKHGIPGRRTPGLPASYRIPEMSSAPRAGGGRHPVTLQRM